MYSPVSVLTANDIPILFDNCSFATATNSLLPDNTAILDLATRIRPIGMNNLFFTCAAVFNAYDLALVDFGLTAYDSSIKINDLFFIWPTDVVNDDLGA
jgi:hypothetical protein